MQRVNVAAVDLNLLVALDALFAEGNVTRAARRVGLTQPAMSHALGRLRALFGDPLFVRTPRGVIPTARGAELAAPVRRALDAVESALAPPGPFDPRTVARTFTIATPDYGDIEMLPPLLAHVNAHAPRVDLWVRPLPEDVDGALASGAIDVVLGPAPSPRHRAQRLFEDRFVCVVREGHPRVKRGLTLARYLELSHLQIAVRGTPGGPVDDALAQLGKARRVALRVPTFLVAPLLVASSDLVATLPERLAKRFAAPFGLRVLEPPIDVPGFALWASWHERAITDPAHAWFRAALARCARGA